MENYGESIPTNNTLFDVNNKGFLQNIVAKLKSNVLILLFVNTNE